MNVPCLYQENLWSIIYRDGRWLALADPLKKDKSYMNYVVLLSLQKTQAIAAFFLDAFTKNAAIADL